MDRSLLVKWFGFPATLLHGDPLVLDRWRWLRRRLPLTANGERLLDVGCGSGAFTIGAARRGYRALGLSWDERNQHVAAERAQICRTEDASFEVQDVRRLGSRADLQGSFDVVICLECIEHILDDLGLMRAMAGCLKPGGRLLLTTPNYHYRPITADDRGPFPTEETGWHVRRGYTPQALVELCECAGLRCESTSGLSGPASQKLTGLFRLLGRVHPFVGWLAVAPFRVVPPLVDRFLTRLLDWPPYSIGLEAIKPRHADRP